MQRHSGSLSRRRPMVTNQGAFLTVRVTRAAVASLRIAPPSAFRNWPIARCVIVKDGSYFVRTVFRAARNEALAAG
jgi:hypothetical protein